MMMLRVHVTRTVVNAVSLGSVPLSVACPCPLAWPHLHESHFHRAGRAPPVTAGDEASMLGRAEPSSEKEQQQRSFAASRSLSPS